MNATTDSLEVLGQEQEFPPRRRRKGAKVETVPATTTGPGADAPTSPDDGLDEEVPKVRKKGIREEDLGDPVRSRRDPFGHDLFGGGYGVW